jgi:predicted small metal-binding protein
MIIKFSCKEMGLNCDFTVQGEQLEEIMEETLAHVQKTHADEFDTIRLPERIERMAFAPKHTTQAVND